MTTTIRRLTGAGVGLVLAAGAVAGVPTGAAASAPATAADRQPSAAQANAAPAGGLTPAQLRQVAVQARAAGDTAGADAAEQLADRLATQGGPQAQSPWVALAKKAIQAVLRHGGSKLPGKFGKYASKMDEAIGKVDSLEEVALTAAFQQVGMPPHLAVDAARWCATFLI